MLWVPDDTFLTFIHQKTFFSLYHAARDINLRVEEVKKQHPNLKCIIHAHSMGGLI